MPRGRSVGTVNPRQSWRSAAAFGAEGRYVKAWSLLSSVEGTDWKSLAYSCRASHLRQIGAYGVTLDLDRAAVRHAFDDESMLDALVNVAADHLTRGDLPEAERLLQEASKLEADWRTQTRWYWVSAEVALAAGDARSALAQARQSVECSAAHSDRHTAKGQIIVAAAESALGQPISVDLSFVAMSLRSGGWATLQWPLALVAFDLADRDLAPKALVAELPQLHADAVAAVGRICSHLPRDLAEAFRGRPDLARLTGPASHI